MLSAFARMTTLGAVFVAAVTSSAHAQTAVPPASIPVMTLEQALDHARAHQPQIRSALAELDARRAEARVPRAQWLPQVGGTAQIFVGTTNNSSAMYLPVPEVDIPRIGSTPGQTDSTATWSPKPSTIGALTVDQQVYDFGRIAAQTAAADAYADVAHANADTRLLEIELGVEESYSAVLAAKAVLAATEEALKRAVTHRNYAQAGTKSGLRPPIDLTRAQAEVALLELRRIRAVSGLEAARAGLAATIGSDALEVDAQAMSLDETPGPAFLEALRTAEQKNPFVAAALARIRAQHATTSAITHEMLPNLFASGGLSGRAGGALPSSGGTPTGAGWLPDVVNWHLGLILQWNIFDGTVLARRAASKAREEATLADLDAVKVNVALGTERAYLDLDAALRALPGLRQSVDAAKANWAQADARFRGGLGTIIELADAEALLTNTELELAVGQFSVARARAGLARQMGKPIATTTPRKGT
jgi:outer membrane protein TolC